MTSDGMAHRTARVERTTARRKFGGYKPAEPEIIRTADVKEDHVTAQLREAWAKVEFDPSKNSDAAYKAAAELAKGMSYSVKDVERFSLVMGKFQGEEYFSQKAGFFLSALINMGRNRQYLIHSHGITVHYLGFVNTKKIKVDGNIGEMVGWGMKRGWIVVDGDAGSDVGRSMQGGRITVKGDAGSEIGLMQTGGEIHLQGDYKSIGFDRQGSARIFHKGKLIAEGDWISHDAKS